MNNKSIIIVAVCSFLAFVIINLLLYLLFGRHVRGRRKGGGGGIDTGVGMNGHAPDFISTEDGVDGGGATDIGGGGGASDFGGAGGADGGGTTTTSLAV